MRQIWPAMEWYDCSFFSEDAWEIPEDSWDLIEQYLAENPNGEVLAEMESALGAPTGCRMPDNIPL